MSKKLIKLARDYSKITKRHGGNKRIVLSERSQSEKATHFGSSSVTFRKRQDYADSQRKAGVAGRKREGRAEGREFFKTVRPFCAILQWWVHAVMFASKPAD